MSEKNKKSEYLFEKVDMNDIGISVLAGSIAGFVDVVFVGEPGPGNSMLGDFTDKMADKVVSFAAQSLWKADSRPAGVGRGYKGEMPDSIEKCIKYLGKKYKVNYDIPITSEMTDGFNMSAENHHFKSLSHAPDLIGLFFSIFDQFTMHASFVSDGRLIIVDTADSDCMLKGTNLASKLFCGVANWFMHIISDVAGHETSRAGGNRGAGVSIPGMELFNLCNFGSFTVSTNETSGGKNETATLCDAMVKVFQKGYDFRFGAALSIPVFIEEAIVKVLWVIKARFYKKREWKDCIPNSQHGDLRIMLITGDATLCVIDGIDASVRSGGNFVAFMLRLNIVAWARLIKLVVKEVLIRLSIEQNDMVETLERINESIKEYLIELGEYDILAINEEIRHLKELDAALLSASSEDITVLLYAEMERQGINLPFKNSKEFDSFMLDDDSKLIL